ncbi:uroporphyrinogen decarboxylase [Alicyclobacillus cellulosilyticus]|uniref:Uroporphyrinogen decarboxylase n=1 Tax=Alicyclobacillus cellulosilyticus TaxID=1003997 RepID=A0A917KCE8_9BACL|nr:uroporphyrinogen decarboxylase [Alicyclobacillus cellulosilyticus]GGJ05922.1 uroporphyrinogen decarboxylase [Alicyclobacillus cellulosilyticus]
MTLERWKDHRFLKACRCEPVDTVPVWYMRQAGRYQPEYRALRERYSLLEICRNPELCYTVTRLPVDQLGVDAAILFSDIMVPLGPMGVEFEIKEHIGPVIARPVRTPADVAALQLYAPEDELAYVMTAIRQLARDLPVPLIGFAGAPFTLASYLIEGGPSRHHLRTKAWMWSQPDAWARLMDKLAAMTVRYLRAQVAAGAAAVQVFDSWVGCLAPADYRRFVLPHMRAIFGALTDLGVPLIYFGVGTATLLADMAETGATVMGIDWRIPLADARRILGGRTAVQGNLDPALLFAPWPLLAARARSVIEEGAAADGFIFNLGWGILHHHPPVDPATLARLTELVHAYGREVLARREGR